jgi:hypothetical protein
MKSRILLGILLVAGIVAAGSRAANASIVLSYTFNGSGEAQLLDMESALAEAIQLSIQGGDGLYAVLVSNEVADDGIRTPVLRVRPINADTADTAIAGKAYLTFSLQTAEKSDLGLRTLELRTLEFDVRKTGNSADFGCLVQSSLDGFGYGRPLLMASSVVTESSDKIHYSIDLSGERFQELSEVDFRVYFYSSNSEEPLEFDGIRLNGKVAVAPEPGSSLVWLVVLGTVLLMTAAGWATRRNRAALSYALAGGGRSTRMTDHEPWTDQARESILNIIDCGRGR